MTARILSGKLVRESLLGNLQKKVSALGFVPKLAIVQVGNREDSTAFIGAKIAFGKKVGVDTVQVHIKEDISEPELITEIQKLNTDNTITSIIVQLPIPAYLDRAHVVDAIDPKKDADALSRTSVENWTNDASNFLLPATARGVRELLNFYKIGLSGKQVTILGRSELVGKPVAAICESEGAVVTVCHSKTDDVQSKTKNADVVIVAIGKPQFVGLDYVKKDQVIIDIGINTISGDKLEEEVTDKKLVGDVDFEAVKELVGAITPVPGGVGPMTVLALFENVVDLCND